MRRKPPPITHALALLAASLGVLAEPLIGDPATAVAVLSLLVLYGSALWGRAEWLRGLQRWLSGREWARRALVAFGSTALFLGATELSFEVLTDLGVVEVRSPMETQLPPGTEDWRMAHLTADELREPDPVLWWRPAARAPYNAQRMKGPLAEIPKPPGVLRILCYGDSNTDGPDRGGWPERLQEILADSSPGRRVEVLNAGVAGYSSHQGLLRFERQVATYEPDLVLVSFGWNDVATALGAPDRAFAPPPQMLVAALRVLLQYDAYRVLRGLAAPAPPPPDDQAPARVPLAHYRENLRAFGEVGARSGARVVLLTRPHREPTQRLRAVDDNWRGLVPAYNDAVRELGASSSGELSVVDVQVVFEGRPDAFVDECHFTPEGHQAMAELLAGKLAGHGTRTADPHRRSELRRRIGLPSRSHNGAG